MPVLNVAQNIQPRRSFTIQLYFLYSNLLCGLLLFSLTRSSTQDIIHPGSTFMTMQCLHSLPLPKFTAISLEQLSVLIKRDEALLRQMCILRMKILIKLLEPVTQPIKQFVFLLYHTILVPLKKKSDRSSNIFLRFMVPYALLPCFPFPVSKYLFHNNFNILLYSCLFFVLSFVIYICIIKIQSFLQTKTFETLV